ncbi:enterobactin receptor protein, partial [Thalassotalea sp. ND16A]
YNLLDKEITEQEYGYVEDGRRYWASLVWQF